MCVARRVAPSNALKPTALLFLILGNNVAAIDGQIRAGDE